MYSIRQETAEYPLGGMLPYPVTVKVDPRVQYSAAPADFHHNSLRHTQPQRRYPNSILIIIAAKIITVGGSGRLTVKFEIRRIIIRTQPRTAPHMPRTVVRKQRRIPRIRSIAKVQ